MALYTVYSLEIMYDMVLMDSDAKMLKPNLGYQPDSDG